MKNTVIANRKKGDWEIIKKYFEDMGVNDEFKLIGIRIEGDGSDMFYYGVINGTYNCYTLNEAQQANATILEVSDIEKEFKVGDVVVVTQNTNEQGKFTEITCKNKTAKKYFNLKDCKHPYKATQMRHATPEEINQYKGISDTVTLPKSFVLHLHKVQGSIWKKRIEEVVPELFPKKMELEVGKWYKSEISLFNYQKGYDVYGFRKGKWIKENWTWGNPSETPVEPATEQEVFDALKKYSNEQGFKNGVKVKSTFDGNEYILNNHSFKLNRDGENTMSFGGVQIFNNGKWATIIPQVPTEIQSIIDKYGKEKLMKYVK